MRSMSGTFAVSFGFLVLAGGAAVLGAACGGSSAVDVGPQGDGGTGPGTLPDGAPAPPTPEETKGIPCEVGKVLADNCISCHASTPQFGAPMPLVTYADLVAPAKSDPSKKVFELIGDHINGIAGIMPPPPNEPLTPAEKRTLGAWLDEGAPRVEDVCQTPTGDGGLPDLGVKCTPDPARSVKPATPWQTPDAPGEQYVCYGVDLTADSPTHVTGFIPRIDNAKIVHHIVLFESNEAYPTTPTRCDSGTSVQWRMVTGWAPGGKGMELPPNVGFPIKSTGTHWVVQMHYSNAQGGVETDTSGFELCTAPPRTYEADVLAFGTHAMSIPPRAVNYSKACSITVPKELAGLNLIAAMPHMHKLGTAMSTVLKPEGGGGDVDLGTTPNYSFDSQVWLPINATTQTGDTITTTCTWTNTTDKTVKFGEKTVEEMCYSFTMYYPKITSLPGIPAGLWSWTFPALVSQCD